jgi:hypothetical protein
MQLFLQLILSIFTAYILLEWVLPWLWYPHLGRHSHPKKLPKVLQGKNQEFAEKAASEEEFIRLWMDLLKKRFHSGHLLQFLHPDRWFETDLEKIWNDSSTPQLCTIYNYLLECILLNSGRFPRKDISHRTVFLNFSMHQFLEVKLKDGRTLELDLWAYDMGLPFGKGAKGFV